MKRCSHCREHLDNSRFHKNKTARDGLQANCIQCSSDIQRKKLYGLGPQEFLKIVEAQGYSCAICDEPLALETKKYAVDHNHHTGAVRGVLCTNCNHGLGKFKDSPDVLLKARQYLLERGHYG